MKKECLHCGDPFTGRSDKKFCCDYCRTLYNNFLNRDETNYIRNINNTLRKNRRILYTLKTEEKKTIFHHDEFAYKGFRFDYFTNTLYNENGKTVKFCYDLGYFPMGDNKYMLVARKDLPELVSSKN